MGVFIEIREAISIAIVVFRERWSDEKELALVCPESQAVSAAASGRRRRPIPACPWRRPRRRTVRRARAARPRPGSGDGAVARRPHGSRRARSTPTTRRRRRTTSNTSRSVHGARFHTTRSTCISSSPSDGSFPAMGPSSPRQVARFHLYGSRRNRACYGIRRKMSNGNVIRAKSGAHAGSLTRLALTTRRPTRGSPDRSAPAGAGPLPAARPPSSRATARRAAWPPE